MPPGLVFTATVRIWLLSKDQESPLRPTDAAFIVATLSQSQNVKLLLPFSHLLVSHQYLPQEESNKPVS